VKTFQQKLADSYARLEAGLVIPKELLPRKPAKRCATALAGRWDVAECNGEAWSEGLCTGCLVARGRRYTEARKAAEDAQRRRDYTAARRAARAMGDSQLLRELKYRRAHGFELLNIDISPDAKWRVKWQRLLGSPLDGAQTAGASRESRRS
jgi:hypothetical protein